LVLAELNYVVKALRPCLVGVRGGDTELLVVVFEFETVLKLVECVAVDIPVVDFVCNKVSKGSVVRDSLLSFRLIEYLREFVFEYRYRDSIALVSFEQVFGSNLPPNKCDFVGFFEIVELAYILPLVYWMVNDCAFNRFDGRKVKLFTVSRTVFVFWELEILIREPAKV